MLIHLVSAYKISFHLGFLEPNIPVYMYFTLSEITYLCLEYKPKDEQHMQGNQPKKRMLSKIRVMITYHVIEIKKKKKTQSEYNFVLLLTTSNFKK